MEKAYNEFSNVWSSPWKDINQTNSKQSSVCHSTSALRFPAYFLFFPLGTFMQSSSFLQLACLKAVVAKLFARKDIVIIHRSYFKILPRFLK